MWACAAQFAVAVSYSLSVVIDLLIGKGRALQTGCFFLAGEMRFGKEDAHIWMRFVCLFVGAAEFKEVGLTDTGRDSDGNKQVFLMDI